MQELPSGYRIITNGEVYRIQKKWLWFWITQKFFVGWDGDSYPYQFDTYKAAVAEAIDIEHETIKNREAKQWREV